MKLLTSVVLFAAVASAQGTPANPLVTVSEAMYSHTKGYILASVDKIPDDLWSFRPTIRLRDVPDDVRDHHARPDRGRLCRTHSLQIGSAVLRTVARFRLRARGALGVGGRLSGDARGDGFRRRHRRPSDGRHFRHRRRLDARAAPGLSPLRPSAARALDGDGRRVAVVGRLVRLQCRQRAQGGCRCWHDHAGDPSGRPRPAVWIAIEWIIYGKPSLVGAVTGTVAGLATITPASGYVGPLGAVTLGFAGGTVCYGAVHVVKRGLKVDDALDVLGVHGVGGALGKLPGFQRKWFGGSKRTRHWNVELRWLNPI